MIKPINNHVLIEPLKHDSFIAQQKDTYQEIGVILDVADEVVSNLWKGKDMNLIGQKVYFDSWLAKKYPVEGEPDKFYWLVKWDDIVACEKPISE